MFHNRGFGKKKDELDEWLADELFPIIITHDKLAVAPKPIPDSTQPAAELATKASTLKTPQPQAVKIRKVSKGNLSGLKTGMVSIKSMLKDNGKKEEEEEIEDFSGRPRTTFTPEQFKQHWEAYIDLLRKDKRASLTSTMVSCHPEMKDQFELNMVFDNPVQESEFRNNQTEILGYLREKLNNWGIHITTEVREVKQQKKYYTNRERFERMIELNPKLEILRQKLNIDPDF